MAKRALCGGKIYDGSGGSPFTGTILIDNERITDIVPGRPEIGTGYEIIELDGKWVTPGFIDIHTHYDGEIEAGPGLNESMRHGVTTVLLGSCGLSMVTGEPDDLADMFTRVEGIPPEFIKPLFREIKDWDTPAQYLEHLDGLNLGPNVACFLGHSTIRAKVMGLGRSLSSVIRPETAEVTAMTNYVKDACDAGFLGLSINNLDFDKMDGDRYRSRATPSVYARYDEVAKLTGELRSRGRILQAVPRIANPLSNLPLFFDSIGVWRRPLKVSLLALVQSSFAPWMHFMIAGGIEFFNRLGAELRIQALPEIFDLYVDGIDAPVFEEFEAGANALHQSDLGIRSELLFKTNYRRMFKKQWAAIGPRLFHRNLKKSTIVACPEPALVGRTFADIAKSRKQSEVDTLLDLAANFGHDLRWTTVVGNDNENALDWIVNHPSVHIGFSDAGAHLRNMAHYNFPLRLLRLCQSRQGTMSIERAVFKLTGELADWYGLDTGRLKKGALADIAVVDPAGLDERLDAYHEAAMPGGIKLSRMVRRSGDALAYTFKAGLPVVKDGEPLPALGNQKTGRVLKA